MKPLFTLFILTTCLSAAEPSTPRAEVIAQMVADFSITPKQALQEPWRQIVEGDNWYHRSRVMKWPKFGPKETRLVPPGDGIDDDIEIQAAIDSLPPGGGKVVLLPGTHVVGNCLRPKNNTELEIRGTLKVADAIRSRLTADVKSGDSVITVADASRFRVGQWVTVSDDNDSLNHRVPRRYGECAPITAIAGNRITLKRPLGVVYAKSRKQLTGYLVSRNAFVTTSHSAIMLDRVERVFIHGGSGKERGIIDGNRANQSATAPLATDDDVEDLRANCGIGIVRSAWVKVDNLLLRNANLHNIAFHKTRHCEASRLECTGVNDKNICSLEVSTLRIIGNHCYGSVMEDGICCHGPAGPDILVANNRTDDNKRYGVHVGIRSPRAVIVNNRARNNRIDLLHLLTKKLGTRINGWSGSKPPPFPTPAQMREHGAIIFGNQMGKEAERKQ